MKINKQTRGVRNNNFGNICRSFPAWKGELRVGDDLDHRFCVFSDWKYGIRALYLLLCKYIRDYKLVTVADIIERYAPASENNTKNYIAYCDSRQPFPQVSCDGLSILYLMSAIIKYESDVDITPTELTKVLAEFGLRKDIDPKLDLKFL